MGVLVPRPWATTQEDFEMSEFPTYDAARHGGVLAVIGRGCRRRCPSCGARTLFNGYLKVTETCPSCGVPLHLQRADDFPPYITITLVAHIVIPAVLALERTLSPDMWLQMAIWLPVTLLLTLAILPGVKGGLIGYQWAMGMHGFDGLPPDGPAAPLPPEDSDGRLPPNA